MYGAHWSASTDKARRTMDALTSLMPNVGFSFFFDVLAAVQRRAAIRSVGAYCTVSYDAVTVVARTAPIDLMALERFEAFQARRSLNPAVTDDEKTPPCSPEWTERSLGPRELRTLIPPRLLSRCVNRRHGEMSFHLT